MVDPLDWEMECPEDDDGYVCDLIAMGLCDD